MVWSNHHRLRLCWVWIGCTCNGPGNWGCGRHCLHGNCDRNWQHAIPCNSAVFDAVGRWNSNDLASWLLTLLSTFVPIHLPTCLPTYRPVCLSVYLSTYLLPMLPIPSHPILALYVGARWCESKWKVWIRHRCSHPFHTPNPCQNAGDPHRSIRMDHRGTSSPLWFCLLIL